ncbi:hypothetical protein PtrSN002B_002754 [Pyrenophora tritici-repentis]|uniref:Tymo-45kd-70kd multi-domain protein n=1 Tax=Pyrenophora tritici-repentis TaxID=45151 RepID=A0A317AH00_9PLEO|nr:hypothetical protein PtrV1_01826 [Pyrenophora tritici-repentis]KAF7454560.1 hypothetical protein A1F99_018180 [Pyrenophora tritici-repentis]KAF7577681.1 Tymo-45kd-70kd multi-domain protein [Pyrenophora tritici-repentis]KAI0580133.1 hypothetical protein Alg215_05389 [Pyrenophora tritici-repentis]KAI1555796.1 hypothetical protein PtrSN002B_002754 [Pyrenophora tritici-repentis]
MLSLPLTSLSTAQDADPSLQRFDWRKETQDLTFVIDTYRATGSVQLVKVVQGNQVRHVIEMEKLISQGNETTRLMRLQGLQMQAEQLPISAIVRCPLLAIRWQLPDKKVEIIRRIQVRFKSDTDFDTVCSHLNRHGLHMSGQKDVRTQPQSEVSLPSRFGPSPTVVAYPDLPARGPAPEGLTCPPSRLAEISSRPSTTTPSPTSLRPQPQEVDNARPFSAFTGYVREERGTSTPFYGPLDPPVYFARPNSATSDILGRISNHTSFSTHMPMKTIEGTPEISTERPEADMLFNRPDSAENLPPRRELPFPRLSEPRSSGSDSVSLSSRPSTGLMGPPPLPMHAGGPRPSSSRDANSKEIELPPLPLPTVVSKTAQAMQQPPRTPDQDQVAQRAKTSPRDGIENRSPLSSSSPFNTPSSANRSRSNAMPTPQALGSPSNAAQNLRRAMLHSSPIPPPTSDMGATGDRCDRDGLAEYAMQSDEDRMAALNEFIFRNLEDDNFLTLVEDVESAWARTGFGM